MGEVRCFGDVDALHRVNAVCFDRNVFFILNIGVKRKGKCGGT